jgi:predicted TIM-barrel fold metal-dependent hydrolase
MVNGMADTPLAAAICHAVNRWLVEEYLAPDPKRLKGVGLIPVQDPPAAVKELQYLAQHRCIVTAMLPTNVYGINLGHRMFDPVYAAAQKSACRFRSIRKPSTTASTACGASWARGASAWKNTVTCT